MKKRRDTPFHLAVSVFRSRHTARRTAPDLSQHEMSGAQGPPTRLDNIQCELAHLRTQAARTELENQAKLTLRRLIRSMQPRFIPRVRCCCSHNARRFPSWAKQWQRPKIPRPKLGLQLTPGQFAVLLVVMHGASRPWTRRLVCFC